MEDYKRAGLGAFITCKCPRCGEGKVFTHSIVSLGKFSDTYDQCPKCNLAYEPETGFFFGAMYWSYALIVGTIEEVGLDGLGGGMPRRRGWNERTETCKSVSPKNK